MKCWNCRKPLPDGAKRCPNCEAAVEDVPTQEELDALIALGKQLDPDTLRELKAMIESADTAEQFANMIVVGECPKCGSDDTQDCDSDPEIQNILVGRCLECGHCWCTECRRALDRVKPMCPCWDEDQEDERAGEAD
jgi:hypothetical protein